MTQWLRQGAMKRNSFLFKRTVRNDTRRDRSRHSINNQLNRLLVIIIAPFIIMTTILLFMLASFNQEYAAALQNANKAAEFNIDFKDNLDLAIWYHVVNGRPSEELPWEEVNNAKAVLDSLQKTTSNSENQWRLKNMQNILNNLSKYMVSIANTKEYDTRIQRLNNDIYTITLLFQTYMQEYTYVEVRELTLQQHEINRRVIVTIIVTLSLMVLLMLCILWYALRFTQHITNPIAQLVQKAEKIGGGDFFVEPLETKNREIKTLDDGFNEMVGRINSLVEKEREDQAALHKAELELLQAQINPHFLYNTLDSLIWLAESSRNVDVVKMVTNLSVFFRNSLSRGMDIITLKAEKEQVLSYLEIQQIRYSDILTYRIEIDEALLQYRIPKMTLQPLVENAIYHGIKNKRGVGTITINSNEEEHAILLIVRDNGVGMYEEQLQKLRAGIYTDSHSGLGLLNVHKRIRLYCGDEYGLSFDSIQGEGTTVTVRIPKNIQTET
jgi:two-component system sensor histidine kinase YesM